MGLTPFSLDADRVQYLAAGLKALRYRSAGNVLSQYRTDAERQGQNCIASLTRCFADCSRSCRRGQGPAVQDRALDFAQLAELPPDTTPWCTAGPVGPAAAMTIGAWWMLREIEASNLRARHVTVPYTHLTLPTNREV